MIRFFSAAMLLSASITANGLYALAHQSGAHFEKSLHCQEGPQGPAGTNGADGATGPTGPTGPAAPPIPPGTGSFVGFGNGNFLVRLGFTDPTGVSVISTCASSGDFPVTIGPDGPEIVQDFGSNIGLIEFSFNVPNDRIISSIAATFTFGFNLTTQPSNDITIRAEVWAAENGSRVFHPTGAGVDFPTINTSVILANTTIFAAPLALNVPVAAGSRLLMVFSRTSNPPITIIGGCSAGIHF